VTGPRRTDAGNPTDWLDFAGDDLATVRLLLDGRTAYWVARGKLAEALEKAMKADLIRRGWHLEKTHDLQRLADQLAVYDPKAAESVQAQVDELAESYTESRYPGFDLDEPDWPALSNLLAGVSAYVGELRSSM
jgi:HEPN domain-containing protein